MSAAASLPEILTADARAAAEAMSITSSPSIGKIAGALAKAQGMMESASKDSTAAVGKEGGRQYKYASLSAVWDAIRLPLSTNELAVIQTTEPWGMDGVCVVTTLAHASGEWFRGRLYMPVRQGRDRDGNVLPPDAQGFGSAITYARRYALQAIAGIAPDDDDAQSAMPRSSEAPRGRTPQNVRPEPRPAPTARPMSPPAQNLSPAPNGDAKETQAPRPLAKTAAPAVVPATPADAMTREEAAAAVKIGPAVERAATPEEVEALRKDAILASPIDVAKKKRVPSPGYWAWYQDTFQRAFARVGAAS